MTMIIDIEKFISSLIERSSGITQQIFHSDLLNALKDQGLEYKNGEIIKTQRRVAAEAKEAIFDSEDEKIRKLICSSIKEGVPIISPKNKELALAWLEKQGDNLVENGYTNNKDFIKYADNYSHEIWHKLMDNFKNIKDYQIGCNDVSDIVLNAIIDACNWLEKQGKRDVRYKYLEDLITADDIHQMAVNDAMVQEAKSKAIDALSKLGVSVLLGLEKQESVEEIVSRCKNSWYNEGKIAGMAEGLTDDEKYQQGWHDALEKQGKQKPPVIDFKAKNWYVSKVDGKIYDMTYNPIDNIEPKFKVGDKVYNIKNGLECTIESIDETCYYCDMTNFDIKDQDGWKLVEQKPTDKAEPKFKVGNWYQCTKDFFGKGVTFDKNTAYYCAKEGCLQNEYGCHIAIVKDLYDNFKLWTIQDARDGDILCTYECDEPKIVFILKGTPKKHYALSYHCYYNIMYPLFMSDSEKGCLAPNDEDVKPTTKEQRDLLFKKIKEAGYRWNADKKKLEKIVIDDGKAEMDYCFTKMMAGEKVSPTWSEEDEKMLNQAIEEVEYALNDKNLIYTGNEDVLIWLKSLKDRLKGG